MNRKKQKKNPIIPIIIGIIILLAGTLLGYLLPHSRYTSEIDEKTKKIESLQKSLAEQKKENEDLQADILEAKKTITDLEEKAANAESSEDNETNNEEAEADKDNAATNTSTGTSSNTSDSSETSNETEESDSDNQSEELASSESNEAVKLVKKYINYANESNVHFDIEGNVPGSSDICIHVYEVVNDGESQHTATWGWYGVNLNSKSVYDTEGL